MSKETLRQLERVIREYGFVDEDHAIQFLIHSFKQSRFAETIKSFNQYKALSKTGKSR